MSSIRKLVSACVAAALGPLAAAQNQALSVSTPQLGGYIEVPAGNLLAPPAITIEAWITYDDSTLPSGWVYPTIARKEFTQGVAEWFLRVNANNNNARTVRLWINGTGGVVTLNWNFTAGALLQWTHIAATYDGAFARLYINGAQVAQANGTGPLVALGAETHIGAGDTVPGSANERWNGLIDELRIWSTARTQADIAASMSQQLGSAPNLVASYRLDGNGLDASGNSAHGTLIASPQFVTSTAPVGPSTYCTAGTSTNGCSATMSYAGTPSAAQTSGFLLICNNMEGVKQGIQFYGISGPNASPWATGSTSTLCVKAPTQRMLNINSGGTLNTCTGSISTDFLAYIAANPGAMGTPLSSGSEFHAQTWIRDPPAIKTTNLSDGLRFMIVP